MTHRAAVALVVLLGSAVLAQTGRSPGDSPSPTPTPQPPTVDKAAPDAPVPDLGTLPTERPKPKTIPQKIGRKLKDAAPRCLDFGLHVCWAQPSAPDAPVPDTSAAAEYAKDVDVGDFYLKEKNYIAAEMRYRDALSARPDDPEATFKLALTLEKKGNTAAARCTYLEFLGLGANLPFAADARKAVDRLKAAGKEPPVCEPEAGSDKAGRK